jgi:small subunit ribosomal protein S6
MKTAYEATFIVDPTLQTEQTDAIVEKYKGVIARTEGEVTDVDVWETRRLAYEVKGRREGRYVIMNFSGEPASRDELDRIFRISDDVLRFLIIKQDTRADLHPSKTRATETERKATEAAARVAANPVPPQPVTDLGTAPEAPEAPAPVVEAVEVEETPEAPVAEVVEEAPAEETTPEA